MLKKKVLFWALLVSTVMASGSGIAMMEEDAGEVSSGTPVAKVYRNPTFSDRNVTGKIDGLYPVLAVLGNGNGQADDAKSVSSGTGSSKSDDVSENSSTSTTGSAYALKDLVQQVVEQLKATGNSNAQGIVELAQKEIDGKYAAKKAVLEKKESELDASTLKNTKIRDDKVEDIKGLEAQVADLQVRITKLTPDESSEPAVKAACEKSIVPLGDTVKKLKGKIEALTSEISILDQKLQAREDKKLANQTAQKELGDKKIQDFGAVFQQATNVKADEEKKRLEKAVKNAVKHTK